MTHSQTPIILVRGITSISFRSSGPPMRQMIFRPRLIFQRPQKTPYKSKLETMIENIFLVKQKEDEYIKQLASKVDLLTTHSKMLETHITQ